MHHVILQRRPRPVLLSRPNVRQYGHLALEIFMAIADAARANADVFFVRPRRRVAGDALFALQPRGVRVLRPGPAASAMYRLYWQWTQFAPEARRRRDMVVDALKQQVRDEVRAHIMADSLPARVQGQLRDFNAAFLDRARRVAPEGERYYQRRLFRERHDVALPAALAEQAAAQAAAHGIAGDAPIVTVHVREPGYKHAREMEDLKPGVRDDAVRNAHIENYLPALAELVERGYTVVRLGDPSMTPVGLKGVVDLALSPAKTSLLELYCLFRSEFMIACESGPSVVSYLTNTPCLLVNCTDPITPYPIRGDAIFMLKRVRTRRGRRELSLDDMLRLEYLEHFRDSARHEYFENTPAEIVAGVREMIELVKGRAPETAAQTAFRERATAAGIHLAPRLGYVKKWGPDAGFLGDGRIARVMVDTRH